MTKRYVLDACALIAFLNDEEGAEKVESLLRESENAKCAIFMNLINLLEVYYYAYRQEGVRKANQILQAIRVLPIEFIPQLDDSVFMEAGRLKAKYRISLADSISLADTGVRNASLVTDDHHELDKVAKQEPI
jgi:PIN domain nuclease of toxin-antitoxin system